MGVAEYEWPRNVFREPKPATVLDDAASVVDQPAIERVAALVRDRGEIYGDFLSNHRRIALGFEAIFGVEVTPLQAILAMDWVKSCRLITSPDHQDSVDDKLGYMHGYDEVGRSDRVRR